MRKIIISAAILITGFAASAQPTSGDSQSASQPVTLNLENCVSIIIGLGFDKNHDLNSSNGLQSSSTDTDDSSIIVKSNRPWAVTVYATPANFMGSDVAANYNSNKDAHHNRMAVVYTATQL